MDHKEYVLITSSGQRYYFYIRECAEIYREINGGEVFVIDADTGMIVWRANDFKKYG